MTATIKIFLFRYFLAFSFTTIEGWLPLMDSSDLLLQAAEGCLELGMALETKEKDGGQVEASGRKRRSRKTPKNEALRQEPSPPPREIPPFRSATVKPFCFNA